MQKPDLKFLFKEIIPALPNPYEFSEKITASLGFIDQNPDVGPFEITRESWICGACRRMKQSK